MGCDYGIFGNIVSLLSVASDADSDYYRSYDDISDPSEQTLISDIQTLGEHFIYVKYIKARGVDNGNASLQFKIVLQSSTSNHYVAYTKVINEEVIGLLATPVKVDSFIGWFPREQAGSK